MLLAFTARRLHSTNRIRNYSLLALLFGGVAYGCYKLYKVSQFPVTNISREFIYKLLTILSIYIHTWHFHFRLDQSFLSFRFDQNSEAFQTNFNSSELWNESRINMCMQKYVGMCGHCISRCQFYAVGRESKAFM